MSFTLTDRALHPIGDLIEPAEFPLADLLPSDTADGVFDQLFYTDGEAYVEEGHVVFNIRLAFEIPIELTLPGIDAVTLVLGSAGAEWTAINVHMVIGPQPSITLLEPVW